MFIVRETTKWRTESILILPNYWTSLSAAKDGVVAFATERHCCCKRNPPRPELCDVHKPWVKWKGNKLAYDYDGVSVAFDVIELTQGKSPCPPGCTGSAEKCGECKP